MAMDEWTPFTPTSSKVPPTKLS